MSVRLMPPMSLRLLRGGAATGATALLTLVALVALLAPPAAVPSASANESGDHVAIYPPIQGASTWVRYGQTPDAHHVVFNNYGYANDWSVDIYRDPGSTVLSPFGSTTAAGHPVAVTVVGVRSGCASGSHADGGALVTLEATDSTTGEVLGRADVMHVDQVAVSSGQSVGPWTPLGVTARFRPTSCYDVHGDAGVHIHLEVINAHRYACYVGRGAGAELGDTTKIGQVGSHNTGPRQTC